MTNWTENAKQKNKFISTWEEDSPQAHSGSVGRMLTVESCWFKPTNVAWIYISNILYDTRWTKITTMTDWNYYMIPINTGISAGTLYNNFIDIFPFYSFSQINLLSAAGITFL